MSTQANKAAATGKVDALSALRDAGEDLSAITKGRTPLIEAVIAGKSEAVAWLLAHGVDMNVCDANLGWTALGWACDEGKQALLKQLIAHGADLERQCDDWQRTPLMCAAQGGARAAVQTLLKAGARLDAMDPIGCTAADLARGNGHNKLADELDAQLPPELRAHAAAPALALLAWPDEAWPKLRWPEDFPPLPAKATWDGARSDALFDGAFHAALAPKLAAAFASPTAALRSWMWAMHNWCVRADAAHGEGQSPPGMGRGDPMYQWLLGVAAVRHAFATRRERKYTHASIGYPPEPPAPMELLSVTHKGASCTIETLSWSAGPLDGDSRPDIAKRGDYMRVMREAQVHAFVLKRQDGQWRVDSWKERAFALTQRWNPQYL